MIEQFYVATELARIGRNFVAIEDSEVATELATTKVFYRPRQSWAVTTGMRARLGCAHDRSASAIWELCRDRLGQ